MISKAVLIRKIAQKDNHVFVIEWSDGMVTHCRLSELQKECPCAACIDEANGKRINNPQNLSCDVRAKRIASVGRYAIKIEFTSGCSHGIYTFDMLRAMNKL